jgi:type III pantothenate kinase
MILCDIGNTSVDILQNGERSKTSVADFDPAFLSDNVYFISVNEAFDRRVQKYENWHDLRSWISWERYYPTMGIDRIMVCEAVSNGVIVDAGSAITVDVMRKGDYQGGMIALGLRAAYEAYAKLSSALDVSFNFEVDLAKMAKNTPDAVSIGFLAPLIGYIENLGGSITLTGGDARVLKHFLPNAIVDEELIFNGMKKLIHKGKEC